jgi:hypothetical protein
MGDHKEVLHERLYLKVPGTEKLRKTAAGRLKHMLMGGWRETERCQFEDHITVRMERTGHTPLMTKLPKPPKELPRSRGRGGPGGFGGRGGSGGFGGRGGPGGPPTASRGGGPGAPAAPAAPSGPGAPGSPPTGGR